MFKALKLVKGIPNLPCVPHRSAREKDKKAAQAKFDKQKRGTKTLKISLPGSAKIHAESPLKTTEFREGANGKWIVKSVSHTLSKDGFKTDLDAEIFENSISKIT